MNLAYRELKFPELANKLHEIVVPILALADQREIPKNTKTYIEYDNLRSLIEHNGEGDSELWGKHLRLRRWFFQKFIRDRKSLLIVNGSIIFSILAIIGCTVGTVLAYPLNNVFSPSTPAGWIWLIIFSLSVTITIVPAWFIKMGTLCETHLFGDDLKGGLVQKLANSMFEKKNEADAILKKKAEEFKAPLPKGMRPPKYK